MRDPLFPHYLHVELISGCKQFSYERRAGSEASTVHLMLPMYVSFIWTDRCKASQRRVLGDEVTKALATNDSCSHEPSGLPNGRGGIKAVDSSIAAGLKVI